MDDTHRTSSLSRSWNRFFFAEERPYGLALLRICLPLALLIPAIPRWPHARELYSSDGAAAPLWENFGYPGMLPIPSGPLAVVLGTLLIVSLITLAVGWHSRASAALAGILTAYLGMLDLLSTLTKFTCISTHLLVLLSLSPCGELWSVDAWLRHRRDPASDAGPWARRRFAIWPQRLMQSMLAIVYFAAAFTKMQTPLYFSGDQMYFWLLTNVNVPNPIGEYMSLYQPLLVAMGFVTITWEVVFPFVCWRGWSKYGVLAVGAVFHLMTALLLGLIVFPMVCLSAYWVFVTEAEFERLLGWLRGRQQAWFGRRRRVARPACQTIRSGWITPSLSAAGFACLIAASAAAGLVAEHLLNPYAFAAEAGQSPLPVIEPKLAEKMLSGTERIRVADKLFGFDVGTRVIGGVLANSTHTFHHGERAIIQCMVVPPHEDLWMEVNLHDERNRLIERSGQILTREKLRNHFFFDMTERYPAGRYDLVLQIDGQEAARRRIEIHSRGEKGPAATVATAKNF